MSWPLIRAQIAVIWTAVNGMANVHEYQRAIWNSTIFKNAFKSGSKILGGAITRSGVSQRQVGVGQKQTAHIATLRFYYSVDDSAESEHIFQQLIDDSIAAFAANKTLNGTCETTHSGWALGGPLGLTIDIIDLRMFGGILCHFGEGKLAALEQTDD